MEHRYENNIKCPYCDWEDQDSWEFGEDSGTHTCGSCGEEFNVVREIEISYSTSRIDCEENEKEHNHKFDNIFISKREWVNGNWVDLQESQWKYTKVLTCSICGDIITSQITKDEYDATNAII